MGEAIAEKAPRRAIGIARVDSAEIIRSRMPGTGPLPTFCAPG
jgi:hypothetical protein